MLVSAASPLPPSANDIFLFCVTANAIQCHLRDRMSLDGNVTGVQQWLSENAFLFVTYVLSPPR